MRIVSWNINGIRATWPALCREVGKAIKNKDVLATFFAKYQADIVCLQESKVSDYSKLNIEHVSVDGYDSFWSFSKKKKGWSGVVTYARKGLTKSAQEGFGDEAFNDEGRCIMTDHEDFVLFNIYF
ncbi:hypothetical protein HK102_012729, partial [Quaeritorhiza haematococci]